MRLTAKQWIQVTVSLLVAIWIFWYLYKDIKMDSLRNALQQASIFYILLSVAVSLLGYWLRAWRWRLLIKTSSENPPTTLRTFWGLMGGYLANLLVPRAGEVARCGYLKKTDNLQMGNLLGTVILERTVDLVFMMMVIALAFVAESGTFLNLIGELVSLEALKSTFLGALPIVIGAVVVTILIIYGLLKKYRDSSIIQKGQHFVRDILTGLKSVRKVDNQVGFWGSSVLIWIIYFLMMYLVAIAIPSTANLTATSVLMVMVMGSIGMIAPVQGGIGTFHALVAFILMTYGLTEEEGKIFAVIVHSSQVLTVMAVGLVSMGVLVKLTNSKQPQTAP
ncbi:flippase-like domain-containing protein [Litoribacter ruber]|uniref:lysylphosphatidylglycerol synthase transmembrane domain-containing protein n=1 Tax=Litoribacter ruber TaxID=702568 RepID=UPI001BD942F2|nr:lysylphosphatidylglycerol synthase transmembrane domain-containing protein [Litoribacter ruber]MBT0809755.1 flippase-like domain-containing protein [Litoribacter ruber]